MDNNTLWKTFLEKMKENISPMLFETWFMETELIDLKEKQATVLVPMHVHKKHLKENYNDLIQEIFAEITGTNFQFEYVTKEEVPEDVVAREKEVLTEQAVNEGKPKEIAEKMVQGRIQKFYKEICLAEQPFVKDSDVTVSQYVKNNGGSIVKMIRFEVGEGMEKREENFAEEVMKQMNQSN